MSNVRIVCRGVPQQYSAELTRLFNELLSDTNGIGSKLDAVQIELQRIDMTIRNGSIGNLKERTAAFSEELKNYRKYRDAVDDSRDPKMTKGKTDDEIMKWRREWEFFSGETFMFRYWDRVLKLREELASHGFRDQELDETVDRIVNINRQIPRERLEKPNPNDPYPSAILNPNLLDVWTMEMRFSYLASEIPNPSPTP
jgi:hypothetical protein